MGAYPHAIARAAMTVGALCLISTNGSAQTVLVPGGEATLGLDGTIDKFYKAANTVISIDLTTNANVIVFYSTDGGGGLTAHYFKKK